MTQKKRSSWLLPLALLLFAAYGGCSARAEVVLTNQEWQVLTSEWSKLESRTNEREKLIVKSEQASESLKIEVNELNQELARLKILQMEQEQSLNETEKALQKAEKSFEQWKKEEQKQRVSLEHKKRAGQIVALAAVAIAASK